MTLPAHTPWLTILLLLTHQNSQTYKASAERSLRRVDAREKSLAQSRESLSA